MTDHIFIISQCFYVKFSDSFSLQGWCRIQLLSHIKCQHHPPASSSSRSVRRWKQPEQYQGAGYFWMFDKLIIAHTRLRYNFNLQWCKRGCDPANSHQASGLWFAPSGQKAKLTMSQPLIFVSWKDVLNSKHLAGLSLWHNQWELTEKT